MTPADLARLVDLDAKATKGPWKAHRYELPLSDLGVQEGHKPISVTQVITDWDHPQAKGPLAIARTSFGPYHIPRATTHVDPEDADLICELRNAAPDLLRAARTLAEIEKLKPLIESALKHAIARTTLPNQEESVLREVLARLGGARAGAQE